jgi:glutamate/aspartate transport system substrate-binding protein
MLSPWTMSFSTASWRQRRFRKDDPQLAGVVERTFRRLAEQGELLQIDNRWFMKRLPSGERLNLTISPQLEEMGHAIGLPE